jgi:nitroreductase
MLLVCYDKREEATNRVGDKRGYAAIDGAIVMTHMMLTAADLGLGAVWVGLFKPEKLKTAFNIPDEYEIVSLMPIGYPSAKSAPSNMHFNRLPIKETVSYESF